MFSVSRYRPLAALCLVLSLLVSACSGSPSAPGPAPTDTSPPPATEPAESGAGSRPPATVSVWSWRVQDEELWQKVQERLNANGENITIEFRGIKSTEYDAVLRTAMSGGDGPDIFTSRGGAGTRSYAEAGLIEPLDAIDLSGFDEGILQQVSYEGQVYAVPFAVQTLTFFYNKTIFEENGLSEPKTWDELMQIMETLKSRGITPIAIGGKDGYAVCLMVDVIGATWLGDQWAQDVIAGRTDFTDPKFVDVLAKVDSLKQYAQDGFLGTAQRDARTLFATGQTAIIIDGIWAVNTYYLQTDPDLQLGSFLAPPAREGDPVRIYPYVDGGYAVNSRSAVKEAALRVAAYTATAEFAQMYADLFAEIPGNKNVTFPADQPMLAKAVQQMNEVGLKTLFRIRSPFDSGTPDISTSLGANIQGMFAGQLTPQQAAENVQSDLASWYPAFQK